MHLNGCNGRASPGCSVCYRNLAGWGGDILSIIVYSFGICFGMACEVGRSARMKPLIRKASEPVGQASVNHLRDTEIRTPPTSRTTSRSRTDSHLTMTFPFEVSI